MCRGDKATSMCAWTSVGRRRGFYNTFHSQQTGSNKPFPGNEHSHRMSSKLLSDTSATLQNEPTLWTGSFCKVAFRSSASVEVVAPLAVRDGGVGPALRLRAVHVLREERDHARRPARASVAAMYSRADLVLRGAKPSVDGCLSPPCNSVPLGFFNRTVFNLGRFCHGETPCRGLMHRACALPRGCTHAPSLC